MFNFVFVSIYADKRIEFVEVQDDEDTGHGVQSPSTLRYKTDDILILIMNLHFAIYRPKQINCLLALRVFFMREGRSVGFFLFIYFF